jgi:hypothetical protein
MEEEIDSVKKYLIMENLSEKFSFLDSSNVTLEDIKKFVEISIEEVKLNPENAFKVSEEIYKILIDIEPNEEVEVPWESFTEIFREVLKDFEEESKNSLNSSDSEKIRKVVGLSSLIGYLSNRALIDYKVVNYWMNEILENKQNKFVKINLMEIVKDQVKNFIDGGGADLNLIRIKNEIEKEKIYDDEFLKLIGKIETPVNKMMTNSNER